MSWPFRRRDPEPATRLPHARPMRLASADDPGDADALAAIAPTADTFTCTTCGRSDLPEAGDWDPPICLECDAAINFDALQQELDEEAPG